MQIRAIKPPSCDATRHDAAIERIIQNIVQLLIFNKFLSLEGRIMSRNLHARTYRESNRVECSEWCSGKRVDHRYRGFQNTQIISILRWPNVGRT